GGGEREVWSGRAWSALDGGGGARLMVARQTEGESTFELVHEALINGWGTLREWLGAAAEQRRVRQRLDGAATEWARLGNAADQLWRGRQLEEAADLEASSLGPREAAFLRASRDGARARKLWRALAIASIPLVLMSALLVAQFRARQRVNAEVGTQLEAAAGAIDSSTALARQAKTLAEEAFRLYDSGPRAGGAISGAQSNWDRAERSWARARSVGNAAENQLQLAGQALEAALLLDSSRQDVRRRLAEMTLARIQLRREVLSSLPDAEALGKLRSLDTKGDLLSRVEGEGVRILGGRPAVRRFPLED